MARYDFISNDDRRLVNGGALQTSRVITFRGIDVSHLARKYAIHRQLNPQGSAVRQKTVTLDADLHQDIEQRSGWIHSIFDRLAAVSEPQSPSRMPIMKYSEPLFKPR
jgi:hypothetical protein